MVTNGYANGPNRDNYYMCVYVLIITFDTINVNNFCFVKYCLKLEKAKVNKY